MDTRLALLTGIDIPIVELKTVIHQPTIREISYIGEEGFFLASQYLCLDKEAFIKDESLLRSTTNFQIFMTVIQDKSAIELKASIESLFAILFPGLKSLFMPKSIILNNMETKESILIDENNFEILQSVLKQIFCFSSSLNGEHVTFNPADKKAKEIADKLMKGRQRIASENKGGVGSIFGRYVSILTVGLNSMSLNDCLNLTMYQLYDLIERYSLYVNWDIDIKSRLAGGKPEEKPDDWMKNIH